MSLANGLSELALAEEVVPGEIGSMPLTPHPWSEPWKGPMLESLAKIPNIAAACRLVGIGRTQFYRVMVSDPAFREAVREALAVGVDFLEQIAHKRATIGETKTIVRTKTFRDADGKEVVETVETITQEIDNRVLMRLLEAYRPDRFRPADGIPKDDLPNPVAGDIDADPVLRRPTRERLRELALLAQQLADDDEEAVDGEVIEES